MTSADGGSAEDGEESPDSDSLPEPAPMDAAAWRAFFAGTSARDTWQVLQKEKVSHARIFAGFRPAPAMLKSNPVVMTRLVDEAVKFPAFAKAVREISAPDGPPATTQSEEIALAEANPAAPDAAANRAAEDAVRVAADALAAREKIKELRSAAGVHIARIKELEAALVRAERDRDTARTEAANHETARRTAETETRRAQTDAEKQKRERERAARRAEMPVAAPNAAASAAPTVALPTAPQTPERLLYEAGERLLLENRFAPVAELCREALRLLNEGALPAISIGERGRVHGLYAGALYGLGDAQNGEHYDRLAATAFLDGGDFIAAAEAMARRFGQGESGGAGR